MFNYVVSFKLNLYCNSLQNKVKFWNKIDFTQILEVQST